MKKCIVSRSCGAWLVGLTVMGLVACAGGPSKPGVAELGQDPSLFGVRTAWTSSVGPVEFALDVKINNGILVTASSDGTVMAVDAHTGTSVWRVNVGGAIVAGAGSDGRHVAVVTRENELVVLDAGKEVWRTRLTSQVFTSPLVAGERVFVLGADRSLAAFDAQSGRKLWQNQRPGEALVLRQPGVLIPVNNTLVAGFSGRLVGMNPSNGSAVWDAAIATPRGTNDIERLVDLVAGVGRDSDVVCVRAFQAAVGCVNAVRGNVIWRLPASGAVGVQSDGKYLFGVESDDRLMAWNLTNGEKAWESERLRYRQLSTERATGGWTVCRCWR
jgi:outer membrane protein assembly factor BamB